jgi:hypothetical protein
VPGVVVVGAVALAAVVGAVALAAVVLETAGTTSDRCGGRRHPGRPHVDHVISRVNSH